MQNVIVFSGAPDAVEQAIRWADRLSDKSMSDADRDGFEHWMAEAEAHRAAFAEVIALWESPALDHALKAAEQSEPVAEAAASADRPVAVGAGRSFRPRRKLVAALAAAAATVTIVVGLSLRQEDGLHYETPIGGRRVVTLQDGSKVTIAGDTAVSLGGGLSGRQVRIERGEAYFEVTRNVGAPFTVLTDNAAITVLGTRFNVDRDGARRTSVSVFEGRVRVSPQAEKAAAAVLDAGDAAEIIGETIEATEHVITAGRPDWIGGWLEIEDRPISEVMRELNRYAAKPVVVQSDVGRLRVSGRFNLQDTDRAVQALASTHHLDVIQGADSIVIRRRSSSNTSVE